HPEPCPLSLPDALPIYTPRWRGSRGRTPRDGRWRSWSGSSRRSRRAPPAASAWSPRCRDRPAGARSPAVPAAGNRRESGRRRASAPPEPLAHEPIEPRAHVRMPHAIQDLSAETVCEDAPGGLGREAAGPEIVQLVLVDRAHRGAVRAFHIVRVDLELGLAVGAGLGREQEVVVGLLRVGPLGAGPHDDAPSEGAM